MPNLAKEFLGSHLLKKKKFTGEELDEIVHTENYGESPANHVEIYTRMTHTEPECQVKLIAFPDGSAAAFKQSAPGSLFDKPGAPTSLKLSVSASHATFATTKNESHKYKNADGADVVVSGSPSPKSKSKKSRGGSYNKRSRRSRTRRGLTRKHKRSHRR